MYILKPKLTHCQISESRILYTMVDPILELDHFKSHLEHVTFTPLDKDKYNGIRNAVKTTEAGLEVPLRLPGCFFATGPIHREEGYFYIWPEDASDDDFKLFQNAISGIEEKIKKELVGKYKEFTPIIKKDKRNGILAKV